jgi:mono/diheme cytochrome c family protein
MVPTGRQLFEARCAACHSSGQPGIPRREVLTKLSRNRIADAMLTGLMKVQATGLTEPEVGAVAVYLTSIIDPPAPLAPETTGFGHARGLAVYVEHCILCHMPDGSGVPGLQPSLRGSAVVQGDVDRLQALILAGPDEVLPAGRPRFHTAMPAFRDRLSQADMADLVSFLRDAFVAPAAAQGTPAIPAQREE